MRFKNLLYLCMASALVISCGKDKSSSSGETIPDEDIPTIASITIEFSRPESRAVAFPGSEATPVEKKINNLSLFIFNRHKMLETVVIEDYLSSGGITTGSVTVEFQTTTGIHYVYAIVNTPTTFYDYQESFTPGTLMESFEREILTFSAIDPLISKGSESRGFMMTNVNGAVSESFVQTENPADNKISIQVGRVVAKVSMAFDAPAGQQQGGVLSNVNYKVMNNPKSIYLIPVYSGNVLLSPNFDDETVAASKYMTYPAHDFQPAITPSTPSGSLTYTYCMENANFIAKEGNASMIVMRGEFTPNDHLDADGNPTAAAGDGTFWRIAKTNAAGKATDYFGGYYSEEPSAGRISEVGGDKAFEYPQGICYYPIWLSNDESTSKYSVKRNSFYKVTVVGVSGAGSNTEQGSDNGGDGGIVIEPETPLEAQAAVEATIEVIDWTDVDQQANV